MAQISITVKNMDEVRHYLRTRPAAMTRELGKALQKSALKVQREARKESPVDTGRLRSGVAIKLSALKAVVSPRSRYAIFVHEGTRPHRVPIRAVEPWARRHGVPAGAVAGAIARKGTKANPFMKRAAKSSERDVQKFFEAAVKRVAEGA